MLVHSALEGLYINVSGCKERHHISLEILYVNAEDAAEGSHLYIEINGSRPSRIEWHCGIGLGQDNGAGRKCLVQVAIKVWRMQPVQSEMNTSNATVLKDGDPLNSSSRLRRLC